MKILELLTPKREIGNFGERAAVKYLKKNGYKIRERNYVALGNEIDIIAEDKNVLAFVEVKTRTKGKESIREPRPACSVNQKKQQSIIHVARYYHSANKHRLDGKPIRFDIVEVFINDNNATKSVAEIKHLVGAFNGDTAYRK